MNAYLTGVMALVSLGSPDHSDVLGLDGKPVKVVTPSEIQLATQPIAAAPGQWMIVPRSRFETTNSNTDYSIGGGPWQSIYWQTNSGPGYFSFVAELGVPPNSQVHELCLFSYDVHYGISDTQAAIFVAEMADQGNFGAQTMVLPHITSAGAPMGANRLCVTYDNLFVGNYGDINNQQGPGWLVWYIAVYLQTPQFAGFGGAALRYTPPPAQ
jgi:hypothetical protein